MAELKKETVHKQDANKKSQAKGKKDKSITKRESSSEKKGLWAKFLTFCNGVKSEFTKVHWPSGKDMLKYSVATILFIVFFALFFYVIEVIFALIQTLFN